MVIAACVAGRYSVDRLPGHPYKDNGVEWIAHFVTVRLQTFRQLDAGDVTRRLAGLRIHVIEVDNDAHDANPETVREQELNEMNTVQALSDRHAGFHVHGVDRLKPLSNS